MKTILLALIIMLGAVPCWATSYFISPSGSDSNNGLSSGAPWLSPNHALNCGDTISAASGTYSTSNFTNGKWGTVTCPSSNNVAWLICAAFDACKISSSSQDAMWVDKPYWGVVGWETTVTGGTTGACFLAVPSGAYILHHVIFADDIANGCKGGGFTAHNTSTTASTDYLVEIGDIAWNAAQGSGACYSGFSIYQPLNFDTNSGTHLFMAGNFSFDNLDPNPCSGTTPTDGEGFNFDTLDHSQGGGAVYTGQAVAENDISVWNGGRAAEAENNNAGGTHAAIFFKNLTTFGNSTDPNQTAGCFDRGEMYQQNAQNVTWTNDLSMTRNGTSCSSEPLYGFSALPPATGSIINNSWWAGISGHNTDPNTPSFVLGTGNTIGTNPAFSNPVDPGAPSCGSFASTAACMATVRANYTPTAGGSTSFGYQAVSNTSVTDALFPAWLCTGTAILNPNIPANLVTPGCGVVSSAAAPTFSPAAGTYGSTQSVSISTISSGAVICYNTTGSSPATNGSTGCTTGTLYTSPVTVSSSETLHAVAGGTGYTDSSVASAAYVIESPAAAPTFSPVAGIYVGTQSVTASTATSGCSSHIFFDTNPTPVTNQTTLSVASSETVYAYVHNCPGFTDSSISSAAYTISAGVGTSISGKFTIGGATKIQ